MRLCRFERDGEEHAGFYFDDRIVPVGAAVDACEQHTHKRHELPQGSNLVSMLACGEHHDAAAAVGDWLSKNLDGVDSLAASTVRLLAPFPTPRKLFLLAGNYAAHIEEGGGHAVERARTFPYVFMKPVTTINHPNAPVPIPSVSPDHIDWEAELAVVIGKTAKHVSEADALNYVAGYTVINDVSDREYTPNPGREKRPKDEFFDWLHGKWHDGFCPMGPCVTSAEAIGDPQSLQITLKVNGETKQDASTALQIYPVAGVIEFISRSITLEPGDIISTGTPSGVGAASGTYLHPGDEVEVSIDKIGVLRNHMVAEQA
ncbi:MAG: fumarylacetoacetate hydrolase family protein [Candidatus Hydrogenedentes bacterium]|nr:fumarylacetoacetate hydrolase family protein [Candidatus Hydrogenedentota bacterium]